MAESINKAHPGVSREEAESILKRFLDNENYKVLVVEGNWGVGKTHLVQKFLSKHKKEYYLYGSVFGISSIEHLKARLLVSYKYNSTIHNLQPRKKKSELTSNWFNKILDNVFEWGNRNSGRLERTPKLDLELPGLSPIPVVGSLISVTSDLVLQMFFNLNAENSIVCIDDLERKSKLPLDELLGFVEYLVQELKCKIILIYKESSLGEESQKVLNQYREKVIDIEFRLNPTVEENLDLIFKDNPDIKVIKEVFNRTGTNNIRVLQKTKWLIDELLPLMENWQPSLRNQVIRNSIIINLAKLDTEFCKVFPISIDTILFLIDSSRYVDKNNDTSERKIQAIRLLSYLGYNPLVLDEQIIHLVQTSFFSSENFTKKGNILNQEEQTKPILEKIRSLGEPYYSSFADNKQEIVDGIITFLDEYHLDLSISQFEQVEQLASLMQMQEDIPRYEEPLLKHMLKTLEPQDFNDLNALRVKLHKYPDLEVYFKDKRNEYQQTLDITTALTKVIESDSESIPWLDVYIDFLNSCTVDEYCQWLQKGHPDLYLLVRQFLRLGLPASQTLEQAIRELGNNSELNKIRAKFIYNIDIDNPDT
jgi:hypothetical protein